MNKDKSRVKTVKSPSFTEIKTEEKKRREKRHGKKERREEKFREKRYVEDEIGEEVVREEVFRDEVFRDNEFKDDEFKDDEFKDDEFKEKRYVEEKHREKKSKKKHCKVDAFIDGVSKGKHITVSKVDIIYTMLRTEEDFDDNLKSIMNAIEKRKRGFEVQTICIPEVDPKKKYPRKVALAWNAMGILLTYKALGLKLPFNKDGFKSLFVQEYNAIGDRLIKLL